jgi:hypothetical protein
MVNTNKYECRDQICDFIADLYINFIEERADTG